MQWYTTGDPNADWWLGTMLTVTVTGLAVLAAVCWEPVADMLRTRKGSHKKGEKP